MTGMTVAPINDSLEQKLEKIAANKSKTSKNSNYDDDDATEKTMLLSQDGSDASVSRPLKFKKKVSFGSIDIHEHAITIGDNPSVTNGCPLTIEWEPQCHVRHKIDVYEIIRPPSCRRTRKRGLKLSAADRAKILMSSGYSMLEIVGSSLEALKVRRAREESIQRNGWEKFAGALQSTTKTIKRATRRRGSLLGGAASLLRGFSSSSNGSGSNRISGNAIADNEVTTPVMNSRKPYPRRSSMPISTAA